MSNDTLDGLKHHSRFPIELPLRCIDSHGVIDSDTLVFDPFAGSGTTGIAAIMAGASFIGFELDKDHARAANERMAKIRA